jgi:hypothetical protein
MLCLIYFVSFCDTSFRFVSSCFVSLYFISFCDISFLHVSFRCISFRFFMFRFVSFSFLSLVVPIFGGLFTRKDHLTHQNVYSTIFIFMTVTNNIYQKQIKYHV